MRLKYISAFSVIVLILFLPVISAGENVTDEIAAGDASAISENAVRESTFEDIQDVVNDAKENDVVELNGTYMGSGKRIEVNKTLTFDGGSEGATLDARHLSGMFLTFPPKYSITLKNINFINAADRVFDCNSFTDSGSLTVDNCNFTDNRGGSVIACHDCRVTNSNFRNNTCPIYSVGHCSLANCSFENNSGRYGGAVLTAGGVIENCSFTQNSVDEGGVINLNCHNELAIKNCIFKRNAAKFGGIISSNENWPFDEDAGTIRISGSNFTDSKAYYTINCFLTSLYLDNVYINASGNGGIYQDLGEFESINSVCGPVKRILVHEGIFSVEKSEYYNYGIGGDFSVFMDDMTAMGKPSFISVKIKVFTGKKSKEYVKSLCYDGMDIALLVITNQFGVGKHKVEITSMNKYYIAEKFITYITIKKAKTIVKAPAVKAKYKKSKKFKITVRDVNRYPIEKLKVKIKVYTGKKSKIYNVKTNRKGVASINTKKLKRGKHKVAISSGNANYAISKKSKIIIR